MTSHLEQGSLHQPRELGRASPACVASAASTVVNWIIPSGAVGFWKQSRQAEVLACRVPRQQLRTSRVTLSHRDHSRSGGRSVRPDHGSCWYTDCDHLEQVRDDRPMTCALSGRHDRKSAAGFTPHTCPRLRLLQILNREGTCRPLSVFCAFPGRRGCTPAGRPYQRSLRRRAQTC